MAAIRHAPAFAAAPRALALAVLLAAGPAAAQAPASIDPGPPPTGRSTTTTGQTKPPGGAATKSAAVPPAAPKPTTEAQMIKAQKAAEARSKAWDTRMRRTMGSICSGC